MIIQLEARICERKGKLLGKVSTASLRGILSPPTPAHIRFILNHVAMPVQSRSCHNAPYITAGGTGSHTHRHRTRGDDTCYVDGRSFRDVTVR